MIDITYITPVEKIDGILFKREDKFKPFNFSNINGSKLRQCILLIQKDYELAKKGIVVPTSILSPQSAIVSSVSKYFNIPCTCLFGGTNETNLHKAIYPAESLRCGSEIKIVSKSGRQSVLNSIAKKTNLYVVLYGVDLYNNKDVLIDSVAEQVKNIPNKLDNLIITCGSGITTVGILLGIQKFNKKISNIYCVGVAPNRLSKINIYLEHFEISKVENLNYIDLFSTGVIYEKTMKESYKDIIFHPRYEAKVFNWFKKSNIRGETCFWITGGCL